MGKIVTLGEVVADAYEEQTPSEWSSSSKPARAATMRRSSVAISPRRAWSAAIRRPSEPAAFGQRVEVDMVQGGDQHIRIVGGEELLVMRAREAEGGHPSRLGRLDAGHRVRNAEALLRRALSSLHPV